MDKGKIDQQAGAQQGNIHEDANQGKNEGRHSGSTLDKVPDPEQLEGVSYNKKDDRTSRNGRQEKPDQEESNDAAMDSEQDTMGNP